jgi:hypothetical protein
MKQGDRWIVFYTDGSIFTSADGTPWDAPRRSVQSIASIKDCGTDWYNINMFDYFYWEEWTINDQPVGGWQGGDGFTMYDHLLRAKHPCVLFGRMLSDAGWKALHRKMKTYCDKHREWLLGLSDEQPTEKYS